VQANFALQKVVNEAQKLPLPSPVVPKGEMWPEAAEAAEAVPVKQEGVKQEGGDEASRKRPRE